jgi:hypothetical protein
MDEKEPLQNEPCESPDYIRDLLGRLVQREREWLDPSTRRTEPAIQEIFAEPAGPKFISLSRDLVDDAFRWKNLYLQTVDQLRTADGIMLWYFLGIWFKSEDIRNPETFFPTEILEQLREKFGISVGDMRIVSLIRLWFPYTEPLVRKDRWLRKSGVDSRTRNQRLQQLGYNPGAVELIAAKSWRSPREFTCEWVASRTQESSRKYERETLVNAYSRYFTGWRAVCPFGPERAVGEFWVCEEAVPHCDIHHPDNLPESQIDAWRDRTGRLWWREGLDIRYTAPSV